MSLIHVNKLRAKGATLIVVLWTLVILTTLSLIALQTSIRLKKEENDFLVKAQNDLVLDSAIRLSLIEFFSEGAAHITAGHATLTQKIFDKSVVVTIYSDEGKIDVNYAPIGLLGQFFMEAGLSHQEVSIAIEKIIQLRNAKKIKVNVGGPDFRFNPFYDIHQFISVLELQKISNHLLNNITTYSHFDLPKREVSSDIVKRSLDRFQENAGDPSAASRSSTQNSVQDFSGKLFHITSCLAEKSWIGCRYAVIRFTGSTQKPFQIFSWAYLSSE